VANSPLVLSHDMIDTSHQIESGGNVHDIMTHTGSLMTGVYEHSHASVRWIFFLVCFHFFRSSFFIASRFFLASFGNPFSASL